MPLDLIPAPIRIPGNIGALSQPQPGLSAPPFQSLRPWEATVGCREWFTSEWPPSFKNIPFAVTTDSKTGGRRIHIHEYPSREWWDNEDMGRLRQIVDVQAFVFGDQCDAWSEALFAVCVDAAIGRLYLPDRPPVDARCLTVESTSTEDKGVIHFTIRFVLETGEPMGLVPSKFRTKVQFKSQVSSAAQNTVAASRATFESGFTGNQNQMARNQASAMMTQVVDLTRGAMAQSRIASIESMNINYNLQRISRMAVQIADLHKSIPDLFTPQSYTKTQKVPGIQKVPREGFGALLEETMSLLVSGTSSPMDLRQALIPLTQITPKKLYITTQATRDYSTHEELILAEQIAALTRRIALAITCVAVIKTSDEFLPEITRLRNTLLSRIDNEAFLASTDDPTYVALRKLRSSVSDYIANYASGGRSTKGYMFQSLMPVAAYAANIYPQEYEGVDRDIQIVKLNGIDHPMFPQISRVMAYVK